MHTSIWQWGYHINTMWTSYAASFSVVLLTPLSMISWLCATSRLQFWLCMMLQARLSMSLVTANLLCIHCWLDIDWCLAKRKQCRWCVGNSCSRLDRPRGQRTRSQRNKRKPKGKKTSKANLQSMPLLETYCPPEVLLSLTSVSNDQLLCCVFLHL